jgi:maltose alpha-D-glucosyltransferase / alpha-amylase
VLDFWAEIGVDGMRLDAIPYLFEREGTNGENLPETHEFLKELRAHLDAELAGPDVPRRGQPVARGRRRLLRRRRRVPHELPLPADAAAVHGGGEEDRFPIIDILQQTPEIPDNTQWALFLRNHDELTLEMVTDEERDYMYRAYAHDPRMRINLGIRRRLAPLLGNDRRLIELMNSLLFSMPGTPVLYYGDEIGMGDNIYLGDRNGVRTPMQWSADRNAGFSPPTPSGCSCR